MVEKVQEAIQRLGFKPSHVASALATHQTRTLGLLVSDLSNPFYAEMARGAEAAGSEHGFSLIICNTDDDREREARHLDVLRQKGVDGIIFASALLDSSYAAAFVESGYPMVLISRLVEGLDADVIRVDDFQGGYLATRHLLSLGHTRIAHIAGPTQTRPGRDRKKGYEAALEEAKIPLEPRWIVEGNFLREGGYIAVEQILSGPPPYPTAFFAGNDLSAVGAIKALYQRGYRVPDDFSVVGYDRTILAEMVEPELTSVAQPMQEMGRQAVEMLMQRIQGQREEPRHVVLPPRLVIGGSTQSRSVEVHR